MIRTMTTAALVLALAACGTPAPDEQEQALADAQQAAEADAQPTATEPAPAPAAACDATQAQWTVGKTLTEAEQEQARKDAGAELVRTVKPGEVMTMEFRADRLNLELDDKGAVTAARCG